MKQSIKVLVLGCMTIGALAGCDWGKSSEDTSESSRSSAFTSSVTTSSTESSLPTSSSTSTTSSVVTSSSSVSTSSTTQTSTTTSAAPVITGITLNTASVKKSYEHGDKLDLTGLVVTANYDNNTTVAVNDYTTDPANGSTLGTVGDVKVTVTYLTFTADFNVSVSAKLVGIAINTDGVKKEYEQGEQLDLAGLVVTAKYSDNTTTSVLSYRTNPENGTVLNEIEEKTVTVTYENFSETFTVNVVKATKKAWTEEEAKIMTDHLNGQVLPFTGFEESVVSYDAEEDAVIIEGGAQEEGYITKYVAQLVALGYEKYFENENAAGYEKEFTTESGLRHVYVYIGFMEGQLYIKANDPYLYAFPATFVEQTAYNYFDSDVAIPEFTADYYEVDADYLCVFCYVDSRTDDAGYSETLTTAGWTIQPNKDDQGYYIGISPDGRYAVAYAYVKGALRIYLEPVNFWNSKLINDFFTKYGGEPVAIPALNVEGAQYQFTEWYNNEMAYNYGALEYIHAYLAIYGAKEADLNKYIGILTEAGWNVEGEGTYTATLKIPNKGVARIEFGMDESINGILVTIYFKLDPLPLEEFPSADVAALLGSDITDVVPAYTGTNKGFTLLNDEFGTGVMVYVAGGTELDSVAAYAAILKQAEYTEAGVDAHGDMRYISKNKQILVTPYYGTTGSFTIAFKKAPLLAFPSAQLVEAFPNTQDPIPAADGALEYMFQKAGQLATVFCTYKSSDEAKAAATAYVDALVAAEYTFLGIDEDGDPHYDSKNSDFEIRFYVDSATFYISIWGPREVASEWPLYKLVEWYGEDIAKAIPAYDKGTEYKFLETRVYNEIQVTVEDADEAVEEYGEILYNAGFTTTYEDDYGDTHYVKGNIDVDPWAGDDNEMEIDIVIEDKPASKWPVENLAQLFQEDGLTDPLPSYDGECDAVTASRYYDGSITILIETDDVEDVFEAYTDALKEAKFVIDAFNVENNEKYTSPSNEYTVAVATNRFGVDITIKKIDNGGGQQSGSTFPAEDLYSYYPTARNVIPVLVDENATFTGSYSDYDSCYSIKVKYETEQLATDAFELYIQALKDAHFTEKTAWGSYTVYVSPDNSFAVWPLDFYLDDGEIYIDVYSPSYFGF